MAAITHLQNPEIGLAKAHRLFEHRTDHWRRVAGAGAAALQAALGQVMRYPTKLAGHPSAILATITSHRSICQQWAERRTSPASGYSDEGWKGGWLLVAQLKEQTAAQCRRSVWSGSPGRRGHL